ncbi:MAG: late competence development ComFB family protein [Oscillospiraceae bacterium]|nr:late competence development ComFB family protein [Oscillospiraceae bacterium]
MALVNVMEKIVDEKLEEMLKGEDCCKCEKCLEDMKCFALNKLPAKYVSSHNGELFTKLDTTKRQLSVDLNIAVSSAIDCVATRPAHDAPQKE